MIGEELDAALARITGQPLLLVVAQQELIDKIRAAFPDYPERLLIASRLVPDNQVFLCPDKES